MATKKVTVGSFGPFLYDDTGINSTSIGGDGDISTNQIVLGADPTSNMHAATKQYVDNNASQFTIRGAVAYTAFDTALNIGAGTNNKVSNLELGTGWSSFAYDCTSLGTFTGGTSQYFSPVTKNEVLGLNPTTMKMPGVVWAPKTMTGYCYNTSDATVQAFFYLMYVIDGVTVLRRWESVTGPSVPWTNGTSAMGAGNINATSSTIVQVGANPSQTTVAANAVFTLAVGVSETSGTATTGGVNFIVSIN